MKLNNLLGWFIIAFTLSLFALLIGTIRTKEPQGRLIKPFPKDTVSDCGWCRAVRAYSLNVNVCHYGDSLK